jgi:hypothetical protein
MQGSPAQECAIFMRYDPAALRGFAGSFEV